MQDKPIHSETAQEGVVLFDGVCNLCNASVNFVIDRDPRGRIKFAPLQSPAGQKLLAEHQLSTTDFDTVVYLEGGKLYTRSSAALRILRRLRLPWSLLFVFIVVPPPLRDLVYNLIARNRYRWFGRRESCRVPTEDLQARFL